MFAKLRDLLRKGACLASEVEGMVIGSQRRRLEHIFCLIVTLCLTLVAQKQHGRTVREDSEACTWQTDRDSHLTLGNILCLHGTLFHDRRLTVSYVGHTVGEAQYNGCTHVGCLFIVHCVLELLVACLCLNHQTSDKVGVLQYDGDTYGLSIITPPAGSDVDPRKPIQSCSANQVV